MQNAHTISSWRECTIILMMLQINLVEIIKCIHVQIKTIHEYHLEEKKHIITYFRITQFKIHCFFFFLFLIIIKDLLSDMDLSI